MARFSKNMFLTCFLVFISLFGSSYAQNCSTHQFSTTNTYNACNTLPTLNSYIHWNYHQSNHTIDIAYRHTGITPSNWIAWCLNPSGGGMSGSQCLISYRNPSGLFRAYTSPISGYMTQLEEGPLDFPVTNIESEFNNNEMVIYATVELPNGTTSFTNVWQYGLVSEEGPEMHATNKENLGSIATIDFAAGKDADVVKPTTIRLGSRDRQKKAHGVLNVVSWGIMMPVGVMTARYLKVFKSANPAWFYLHVTCQSTAYVVGVAGWATGMRLGSKTPGIVHTTHRNIGITLFVLGTLQALAVCFRPNPKHKYRKYWNVYHQSMGYTTLALTIANILEGLNILDPGKKWKNAYIGVIIFLGSVAVVLEAFTWYIVLKRKTQPSADEDASANSTA